MGTGNGMIRAQNHKQPKANSRGEWKTGRDGQQDRGREAGRVLDAAGPWFPLSGLWTLSQRHWGAIGRLPIWSHRRDSAPGSHFRRTTRAAMSRMDLGGCVRGRVQGTIGAHPDPIS